MPVQRQKIPGSIGTLPLPARVKQGGQEVVGSRVSRARMIVLAFGTWRAVSYMDCDGTRLVAPARCHIHNRS